MQIKAGCHRHDAEQNGYGDGDGDGDGSSHSVAQRLAGQLDGVGGGGGRGAVSLERRTHSQRRLQGASNGRHHPRRCAGQRPCNHQCGASPQAAHHHQLLRGVAGNGRPAGRALRHDVQRQCRADRRTVVVRLFYV